MTPVSQTVSGSFPRGKGPPDGRVLLLSELFPPGVGGSAVLLHGIYSRLPTAEVTVLADGPAGGCPEQQGTVRVIRWPLATARWGVLDRGALRKHLGTARQVRSLARQGSVVHCARALPEGAAAMLARLVGGAPDIIWAHGEDIASALSSRELTLLTRAVVRGAAGLLANSRNTADPVRRMGAVNGKVRGGHPAVDAGRFHPGVQGNSVRERFAVRGHGATVSGPTPTKQDATTRPLKRSRPSGKRFPGCVTSSLATVGERSAREDGRHPGYSRSGLLRGCYPRR